MAKIKYPYQFDPKKRKIAEEYRKGRMTIYFADLFLTFAIALAFLYSGLHLTLRNIALQLPFSIQVYGFLVITIFTLVGIPMSFYSSYTYEHKFKLSRYKISGWLADFLKGTLISYIIALAIISLLFFTIRTFSPWWLYAGVGYVVFLVFMSYVYPVIIVPFMWKTEPYKDNSMKGRILNLCRKLGVNDIKNVVVIKESEKSVRPNAVFMGIGNSKRIGLFDNLINGFTKDEVETVVGHELGHYVNKDIFRSIIIDSVLTFPVLFAIDYFVKLLGPMFGIYAISDLSSLVLITLLNGIILFFLMPIVNSHSRWRESQADLFALNHVRKPVAQVSTEKRLADMSLSPLSVNQLVELWLFTHPPTIKRIQMARQWNKRKKR